MSKETHKSLGEEILEGLTELRDAMRNGEQLRKKFTIRTVELDLEEMKPREYGPKEVRETRDSLQISQAVFASMLAVSKKCVESWEQGTRAVSPLACRVLDLINCDPDKWLDILGKSVKGETASPEAATA